MSDVQRYRRDLTSNSDISQIIATMHLSTSIQSYTLSQKHDNTHSSVVFKILHRCTLHVICNQTNAIFPTLPQMCHCTKSKVAKL